MYPGSLSDQEQHEHRQTWDHLAQYLIHFCNPRTQPGAQHNELSRNAPEESMSWMELRVLLQLKALPLMTVPTLTSYLRTISSHLSHVSLLPALFLDSIF